MSVEAKRVPTRYRKARRNNNNVNDPADGQNANLRIDTNLGPTSTEMMTASSNNNSATTPKPSSASASTSTVGSVEIAFKLPSQTVTKLVSLEDTFMDVLERLVNDHRYELTNDVDEFIFWEVMCCYKLKVRRPLRPHEYVKHVYTSWGAGVQNYIAIDSSARRLETSSIASLVPRRDIVNNGASFKGQVYFWRNQSDWKKSWLEINQSGVMTLRKRQDSRDIKQVTLSEVDLYENVEKPPGQPGVYALTISSQQSVDYFVDKNDAVYFLAVDSQQDYETLRNIFYSLRSGHITKLCNTTSTTRPDVTGLVDEIPLAKLQIDDSTNPRIKPDGLLGNAYPKAQGTGTGAGVASPTDNYNHLNHKIKPEGLLGASYPKKSPITQTPLSSSASPIEAGRGLLGQAYSSASTPGQHKLPTKLPQHSMALQHQKIDLRKV